MAFISSALCSILVQWRVRQYLKEEADTPLPDFPLYAHSGKVWAKEILGKVWYFGAWDDPQTALE